LERLDVALIVADRPATSAAVTTKNLVAAAPVELTRERMRGGLCRAILINSGNANAYTGSQGKADAVSLTKDIASALGEDPGLVIPMSTGVIGIPLPVERIRPRIPDLVDGLDHGSYEDVAKAMLTTDTKTKLVDLTGEVSSGPFHVLGMAKGSGMIAPYMATMLAVILVDIRVEPSVLRAALREATDVSFNIITVDGDMSTNDTVVCLTGGSVNSRHLGGNAKDREVLSEVLSQACLSLAKQIIFDGEGATKAVQIHVEGTPSNGEAAKVARTIGESCLVKTALHGEDPNWGRIISSAGRAGVHFDPDLLDLFIGDVQIIASGNLVGGDWEKRAAQVMKQREFQIRLDLRSGPGKGTILTSDLSEEYVSINADYRS
jgi:glutamate N-acetyltransferase/amino-acid N-acetyltransferase